MICWRREATVRQGHLTGGRRFARDIAAHGNARGTFRGDHARFGQLNRLLWLGEFADLTARAAW